MATKMQSITDLALNTTEQLCKNENWTSFLRSAAWQYKYSFQDQVYIYAQRPDAKACATLEMWNKNLHRWINKGAKGIALLRRNNGKNYLDYVFDISDTNSFYGNEVRLWEYNNKYFDAVAETLENRYGEFWYDGKNIADVLICTGQNIVLDNKADYLHELKYAKENSFLEGYDELNIDKRFQQIAETSVAYMTMVRMGIEPDDYFVQEDFEGLWDFNTPETMSILGNAVSIFAEEVLREVQSTIVAERKAEKNNAKFFAEQNQSQYNIDRGQEPLNNEAERADNSGNRIDIPAGGRLSDTESRSTAEQADRQIRQNERELPEATPQGNLHSNDDEEHLDGASVGNRTDSERTDRADGTADGESRGNYGADESGKPVEVDRAYEQPFTFSGRSGTRTSGVQLSLFPLIEEQQEYIRKAEQSTFGSAFFVSQQIIDEVLTSGSNEKDTILEICSEFSKNKGSIHNAEFLKNHYKVGGKGFVFGEQEISVWWNENGVKIDYGRTAEFSDITLTWEKAAERIEELLELGRFAPQETLDKVHGYELENASHIFWYMHQDVNFDQFPNLRDFFSEEWFKGGFDDSTERIAKLLDDPDELDEFIEVVSKLYDLYEDDNSVMRFRLYQPEKVLPVLEDLRLVRKQYTANIDTESSPQRFITEDEINSMLIGTAGNNKRFRIYKYFTEHTDKKERTDFLKKEYGWMGSSSYPYSSNNDNKGFSLSRRDIFSPFAKVELKWSAVEKRISNLIKDDLYLTEKEKNETYPEYLEKEAEAERIAFIRKERVSYLDNQDQLSESEKKATLPRRLFYYVETISNYSKSYFEDNGLPEMLVTNEMLVGDMLKNPVKRRNLVEALTQIQGSTGDVYTRKHASILKAEVEAIKSIFIQEQGNKYFIYDTDAHKVAELLDLPIQKVDFYGAELDAISFDISEENEKYFTILDNNDYLYAIHNYDELATLQDFFAAAKADDVDVRYDGENLIAVDDDGNVWTDDEIYDFILNDMLVFDSNGELSEGIMFDTELIEKIKHYAEDKYGVPIPIPKSDTELSFAEYYAKLHRDDEGKTIALFPVGDFYEAFGADAEQMTEALDLQLIHRVVEGTDYPMCGIPKHILEKYVNKLNDKGFDVILVEKDRTSYKVISTEKALNDAPKQYELGYGRLGNGTTVWNKLEEVDNDYKIVAHISDGGKISYREELPDDVRKQIENVAQSDKARFDEIVQARFSTMKDVDKQSIVTRVEFARQYNEYVTEFDAAVYELIKADTVLQPNETEPQAKTEYATTRQRLDEQLSKVANCKGYAAFKTDVEILWRDQHGDSLVGYVSDGWLYNICNASDDELLRYVEQYTAGTLDAYKTYRENEEKSEVADKEMPDIPLKPQKQQRAKVENTVIYPEIPLSERNNFIINNDELGYGTAGEKYAANVKAIRTLKELENEHRLATPEEQEILSNYVGWGGLPDVFDEKHSKYQELKSLLTDEEYKQARASTLNAHYTSPTVIKAMYKALENMGFKQGNVLEPSCGIGNFMGLVPESMKDSKLYGIEIDSITGRIAQQLYQKNSVAIQGYENTTLPDSFFDVAIGNVPFGNYKLPDKKYNKHNFLIHDYFFAKTLDKVRPGGIVAFITSSGTMDKQNSAVRKYIAQRADLIGAIRLPNDAFLKNAGTKVTADILFLQKRDRMTDIMPEWMNLGTLENGLTVNQYFVDNPDMILGEMTEESSQYGHSLTCKPYEDADLAEQLDGAIQNIHATMTEYEFDDISVDEEITIPADPSVRNFSYCIVDGYIYFRENSIMRKTEFNATAQNRIKGMVEIRDCVRKLIEYQSEDYTDDVIIQQQEKLNKLYDNFTKKYGLINSRGNSLAFSEDSSYFLLCSLEVLDENGELERKADIFTKRTIGAKKEITKVDTASEALAVSLGEKVKIDMEFMSSLTGKTEEELYEDLKGVIFLNPQYTEGGFYEVKYLPADEYLSGNVREKLRFARAVAETDSSFKINVEALEKVQPKDLTAAEISVRLGSTWIPQEYAEQFTYELLGTSKHHKKNIKVRYYAPTSQWNISHKSYDSTNVRANSTYGTKRASAYKIIEDTLNLRDVRVYDYKEKDGKPVRELNAQETAIAQQKQEIIKQEFQNWIWNNPERRERLTSIYNEKFNSTRPREYDGSHITFSGINPEIELRQHQKDAVARIMYGGNSLLGHVVGAGKTWTMVAAAMESKRLGLCNKSLFVVPNHLTEQWASEFLQLYPAANILVATRKDFETKNRKKFCGRIATGEYDAVIIGHSQFEKIPMSAGRQIAVIEDQIDEVINGIAEAKANNAENYTIKQMEKTRKSLIEKLDKLNDQSRKDDVVTFEELGVDRVFVDEAHYYKNLFLYTKMRNVGGIAQTEAQKSSDLFMKSRYLDEITGGKGLIFATGTPISNSMVELYTMQRYLQYNALVERDLQHFDSWASTYGETVTTIELAPEGTGYRPKTRFAKFFNLPELMAMFKEVADIQTADMLNLPTPEVEYHNIAAEATEIQKEFVAKCGERADKVRNGTVDPSIDNMLKITNDGRKIALDQRMNNPLHPDDERSKVNLCVNAVYDVWDKNADTKATQLIFCDMSTPKNDGNFNVYDDMKLKLIEKGIPEHEIAFIHHADTEVKKKELFSKVRSGDVRVLFGSTSKMGAGTNVQKRLIASHDLDCPWRPADLEQRAGRIIRQGNSNKVVHIYRYVTKDTFDSYMWQTVENKQRFISQIMTSKSPARSADDIDATALSYAEVKALSASNPYIKEKMELDTEVAKLKMVRTSFMNEKYSLEDRVIKYYPQKIASLSQALKGYEKDHATISQYPKQEDKFYPMTIDGLGYFEKKKAGEALIERCKKITTEDEIPIGDYRGFSMSVQYTELTSSFQLHLKGEMTYSIYLGADVHGNIQRIDNALEDIGEEVERTRLNLEDTKKQFEVAKVDCKLEFPQEAELNEKLKRLAKLDALLNMDKKGNDKVIMSEPEDNENIPLKKVVGLER